MFFDRLLQNPLFIRHFVTRRYLISQLKVPFSNSDHNHIFSILLQAAQRGIPVAEFNMEETPVTHSFGYYFSGPCGTTLPEALQL